MRKSLDMYRYMMISMNSCMLVKGIDADIVRVGGRRKTLAGCTAEEVGPVVMGLGFA
jgi:hypothetical protein